LLCNWHCVDRALRVVEALEVVSSSPTSEIEIMFRRIAHATLARGVSLALPAQRRIET